MGIRHKDIRPNGPESTNHSNTNRNLTLDHDHGLNYSHLHAQWLVSPVFQLGVLPGLVGPSNDHVTDGFQSESDEWRIRVPIWSAHFPCDARGGS